MRSGRLFAWDLRRLAYLDVGHPDLGEGFFQWGLDLPESISEALYESSQRVDREPGLGQVGRFRGKMKSRQLEQPVGVVGYDNFCRGAQQLAPQLVESLGELGLFLGAEVLEIEFVGRDLSRRGRPGAPGRAVGRARVRGRSRCVGTRLVVVGRAYPMLAVRCPEAAHAW